MKRRMAATAAATAAPLIGLSGGSAAASLAGEPRNLCITLAPAADVATSAPQAAITLNGRILPSSHNFAPAS